MTPQEIQNNDVTNLVRTIYMNFESLSENSTLNHGEDEIYRIITSPKCQLFIYLVNKKIAGYLLGELMNLNDGRFVFYITYIYTGKRFRNKGIASDLLKLTEQKVKHFNLDGIVLTVDTEEPTLLDWYTKKGFMPDMLLRTYGRHEVLSK